MSISRCFEQAGCGYLKPNPQSIPQLKNEIDEIGAQLCQNVIVYNKVDCANTNQLQQ